MLATDALKISFEVLHYSGATTLARPFMRGVGAIFCLHQVCPGGGRDEGFAPNHQLEISPEFLDAVIVHMKAAGYDLISLDEAIGRLSAGHFSKRPFAVFTLDDGYIDNMEHAAPVFRRHNCPYTIYVSPFITEGKCELWWRILEQLIAKGTQFDEMIDGSRFTFETSTVIGKKAAAKTLFPAVKALPEYEQRHWIRDVAARRGIDVDAYCRSVAMTWAQLRELIKDPLCTIGAHTTNHYAVKRLSDEDALGEMANSKSVIEKSIGREVRHFAYPYGDEPAAGPRDFRLAQKAGFVSSVTTRKGVVYAEHAQHLQALPRVMMSGRYQKIRYVDALVSGLPLGLLNRLRRVNVS
jgi:peptidoglycan/xylan/chitin deacetylase (PgdA/CDA1 family)